MLDSPKIEIDLHNIHQMSHLGKDEDSMVEFLEFREDSINKFKFSGGPENPIMVANIIETFEEHIRMITTLSQLHH